MTCTQCVTIMGPCREGTTQLTARTPSMDSGTALMTAMFIPSLRMRSASRLVTSCSIRDVQQSHLGLQTVLWEAPPVLLCVNTGLVG